MQPSYTSVRRREFKQKLDQLQETYGRNVYCILTVRYIANLPEIFSGKCSIPVGHVSSMPDFNASNLELLKKEKDSGILLAQGSTAKSQLSITLVSEDLETQGSSSNS